MKTPEEVEILEAFDLADAALLRQRSSLGGDHKMVAYWDNTTPSVVVALDRASGRSVVNRPMR